MTGKRIMTATPRRVISANNEPPLGDWELRMRRDASRDASQRLFAAIERLVERTAEAITVPPEWSHRPVDFARAYLGMEVKP